MCMFVVVFTDEARTNKMDQANNSSCWCQLVCSTDVDAPILYVNTDSFTIGRSKGCDLCIPGNHLISSRHCSISKDSNGEVWLQDNSKNGTVINHETRISKGQKFKLKHGDEIHVVYKKNYPESNVAYLYQDTAELKQELDSSTSDLQKTDCTSEYNISVAVNSSPEKEQTSVSADRSPAVKRIKLDDSALGHNKSGKQLETSGDLGGVKEGIRFGEGPSGVQVASTGTISTAGPSGHISAALKSCERTSGLQKTPEISGLQPSGEQTAGVITSDEGPISYRETDAVGAVPSGVQAIAGITFSPCELDVSVESKAGPSNLNKRDDMEETLLCSICQDILHNAVSLQPCMHTFCAACYSSWMTKSKECPSCRIHVDRIGYNHIVKNLVEAYLKEHPNKKRSDEEIKEMDEKNKITNDMVYPKRRTRESFDYQGSSDSFSGSDSDNSLSTPTCQQCPTFVSLFGRYQSNMPPFGSSSASCEASCSTTGRRRRSSASTSNVQATTSGQLVPDGPSDDQVQRSKMTPSGQVVPMPNPPQFCCEANANHLMCMCCMQHMPDRRSDRDANPTLPPQSCSCCDRYFCHMYWGCSKPTCLGCLNQLKDLKFSQDCTRNLVNNNQYESQILMNYIHSKSMTYLELFQECLARMDSNRYKPPSQVNRQTTSSSVFCYVCGLTIFKELAYLYRKDIPSDELPNDVISRPNCYWGSNCRTQARKPHHARNFNHICEQTRH